MLHWLIGFRSNGSNTSRFWKLVLKRSQLLHGPSEEGLREEDAADPEAGRSFAQIKPHLEEPVRAETLVAETLVFQTFWFQIFNNFAIIMHIGVSNSLSKSLQNHILAISKQTENCKPNRRTKDFNNSKLELVDPTSRVPKCPNTNCSVASRTVGLSWTTWVGICPCSVLELLPGVTHFQLLGGMKNASSVCIQHLR